MDRYNNKNRAGGRALFLVFCFALVSARAFAAGVVGDGTSDTSVGKAPNGVPVVNIANPNSRGLSHNKYRKFNVDRSGLILNNSKSSSVRSQLGGQIKGNAKLSAPARVILNEVTSTSPSELRGYTEVAGSRADVVIANPNGISVNGAGFINSSRVTLTTGSPRIDAAGNLSGFDVRGGEISIHGDGLDTRRQSATSIYSHYLRLNAGLHARDLDIALGQNQIDYPGRKVVRVKSGSGERVLLDSSALGGMYANKIVLVGTDRGLGINLPPEVIASHGEIRITNDGRIELQQLDATGMIAIESTSDIESTGAVYSARAVEIEAAGELNLRDGMIASRGELEIKADRLVNQGLIFSGLNSNGFVNDWGDLEIETRQLDNRGEITSSHLLEISADEIANAGLINAASLLRVSADVLTNEATLFSGNDAELRVGTNLTNLQDASIFSVDNLLLAGDSESSPVALIRNDLGLIQTLEGDIDIYASRFENSGRGILEYEQIYYDLGNGREVDRVSDAKTINLSYHSGYTKHKSNARRRWVREVLRRLRKQAPLLYADNEDDIRRHLSARFRAIETRLENRSETTPAYLDSGNDLNLNVGTFINENAVTSAARDINFAISGDYRNEVLSVSKKVKHYDYSTHATHKSDDWDEDRYSSKGKSRYIPIERTVRVTTDTVTQAGRNITGTIGGIAVNSGVKSGKHDARSDINPSEFERTRIVLPESDFGLFVKSPTPDSGYLIETNPRFTRVGNFESSDYLLDRLDFSASRTLKRLGDAFYESQLIRENVFTLTGRRYLDPSIGSDNAQFRYLMDNALLAQADLELAPGVALDDDQINRLTRDIVWLEETEVAGERVLVPTVYLANGPRADVRGGRIVAGESVSLTLAKLENSGLIESDGTVSLEAAENIDNKGVVAAARDLTLTAKGDIDNVSGNISGGNVSLRSIDGSIVNRRSLEFFEYKAGGVDFDTQLLGEEAVIEAAEDLRLEADQKIEIRGSRLGAARLELEAGSIEIAAQSTSENFVAGDRKNHFAEARTRHFASALEGEDIVIFSRGAASVSASRINAVNGIQLTATSIDIGAREDNEYFARTMTSDKTLGEAVNSKKRFRGRNLGSELNATTVVLVTENGDIEVTGSRLNASGQLVLDSSGDIVVDAGRDSRFDENYSRESGWFSGGSLYEETEDLEGRVAEQAVRSRIDAASVSLDAGGAIALTGVDIDVVSDFNAAGSEITLRNAFDEETRYSKHTRVEAGFDDLASNLGDIDDLIEEDDGRLTLKLADAKYEHAEHLSREKTAVVSEIGADSIRMTAGAETTGNIVIEGSDLKAAESIELTAGDSIALLDAHEVFSSESKTQDGTAALSLTLQNEYDQVARAVREVKEAERNLRHARDDYDAYQRELDRQEKAFEQLRQQLERGEGFVEQADVDDFERKLRRLRDDESFYKRNIVLATATLTSKTTLLVEQTGRAAASSGTLGFNLGSELEIDALEHRLDEYYRRSIASSLEAAQISINAGATAQVRGSDVVASERIDISAENIDIRAGVSGSELGERTEQVEYAYRWDLLGEDSSIDPRDLGASVAGNGSRIDSESTEYSNSRLLSRNINLQASGDLEFKGAGVHADEKLAITGENLSVASVQDLSYRDNRTEGLSYSRAGGSLNVSRGDSETVQTRVTRLSGQQVEINVGGHTDIKGATIAAIDAGGNDNGNLSISTKTLRAGSLVNTYDEDSRDSALGAGKTATLDYQNDRSDTRTKTLATLGSGDVQIEDETGSDIRFLNSDIDNAEVAIYDIESHQGLAVELDIRLLSVDGRKQIAEDWLRTGMIGNTIKLIATSDRVGIEDFFGETEKSHRSYEALKTLVRQDPVIAAMLQNPGLTASQKRQMLDGVIGAMVEELGYEAYDHGLIVVEGSAPGVDRVFGYYSQETGRAYINDPEHEDTHGLVATAGHEAVHAMDAQAGVDLGDDSVRYDNNEYADNFGRNLADYTGFALDYFGYGQLAMSNDRIGLDDASVGSDTREFENLDHSMGDFRQLHLAEGRLIMQTAAAFAQQQGITQEAAIERLRAQAMRDIDSQHDDGKIDPQAARWLGSMSVGYLKGRNSGFDVRLFAATEAQRQDHALFGEHREGVENYLLAGMEITDSWARQYLNTPVSGEEEFGDSNFERLDALARIEVREQAFGAGGYGEGDLIYGFLDANNDLRPIEDLKAYESTGSIVLNPNEIGQIVTGNLDKGFDLEYAAAVEAMGLNPALIDRDSNDGRASWGSAPGQADVLREGIRYLTQDSPTPFIVFDNGNASTGELSREVLAEIGDYPGPSRLSEIDRAVRASVQGDVLNLSSEMELATALTIQHTSNSLSGFNRHVQEQEGFGAFVTSSWTGMVEQTIRNWEIVASDDKAPGYMKDSAAAGVSLDLLAILPAVRGLSSPVKSGASKADEIDLSLASGYRKPNFAGAMAAQDGLPKGYSRVVLQDGEHAILGPRGGIYRETDRVDRLGNPLYKNSGKYYSMEGNKINVLFEDTKNFSLQTRNKAVVEAERLLGEQSKPEFTKGKLTSSKNPALDAFLGQSSINGLDQKTVREVVNTPKGKRPDPSTYMSDAQIKQHLAQFEDGAVRIISKRMVEQFDSIGPPGGLFVFPKSYYDNIVKNSDGNMRYIEKKLGFPKGYLDSNDLAIAEIPRPTKLRIPSGNETGANQYWIPGGNTLGGVPEAVVDPPSMDKIVIRDFEKD